MSEERTIKGIVAAYAKEVKENDMMGMTIFSVGLKIGEDWHNITADAKEKLETLKTETAPLNSEIEFVEYKKENSKYWNFKTGTFKLLKKGDGVPKKSFGKGSFGYRPNKDEYWLDKSNIIAQTCLNRAVELVVAGKIEVKDIEAKVGEFAGTVTQTAESIKKILISNDDSSTDSESSSGDEVSEEVVEGPVGSIDQL